MIMGMTANREACQLLIDKYQDKHLRDRAFELAWTHSQVVLRQINASEADAQMYGRLASSIVYTTRHFAQRHPHWQKITGDNPLCGVTPFPATCLFVLLQIGNPENISLVKQMYRRMPTGT